MGISKRELKRECHALRQKLDRAMAGWLNARSGWEYASTSWQRTLDGWNEQTRTLRDKIDTLKATIIVLAVALAMAVIVAVCSTCANTRVVTETVIDKYGGVRWMDHSDYEALMQCVGSGRYPVGSEEKCFGVLREME